MVAETIQTKVDVISAAQEVVTKAAVEASLGEITAPPKQLYVRGERAWWGRDIKKSNQDDSNVVWCRARR